MAVNTITMSTIAATAQHIHQQIDDLPPESLAELADYLEFLRYKADRTLVETRPSPLRIIKLRGLLKGYDFPPDLLLDARREMWRKFQDDAT